MELLHRGHGIWRDPQHDRADLLIVGAMVAHPACLDGTARRVGLRVEVDDHRLAAEVRELDRPPVLVRQLEVRGVVSLLDHAWGILAARLNATGATACGP